MFYSVTFAPAFERERRSKMMKQIFLEKSSEIIWKFKRKNTYLCIHVRKTKATKEFFERFT